MIPITILIVATAAFGPGPSLWAEQELRHFSNGRVSSSVEKIDGERQGPEIYFYESGEKREVTHYLNDNRHGAFIQYARDGRIIAQGTYKTNFRTGLWQWFDNESGKLKESSIYEDDKRHGRHSEYEDGVLVLEIDYYRGHEKYEGVYHEYFRNGKPRELRSYKQGALHGARKVYTYDYQLREEGHYQLGKEHGKFVYYSSKGSPDRHVEYLNGEKHGLSITYYDDGTPHEKTQYARGLRHGLHLVYFDNGKLSQKLRFQNGLQSGRNVEYMMNEKPRAIVHYRHGKRHGKATSFHPDGTSACSSNFFDDKLVDTLICLHSNGKKGLEEVYQNDVLTDRKYFDTDGRLIKDNKYFKDGSIQLSIDAGI